MGPIASPARMMATLVVWLLLMASGAAAEIELLDGTKLTCRVLSKTEKVVKVELTEKGKKVTREYELARVHKVTINDKVHLINPKSAAAGSDSEQTGPAPDSKSVTRSAAEIEKLIDQQGRTPPDWFEATPVDYPPSLDLSWPEPAPGPWDNQKNMGQYIWDVINPNESKWKPGIRLMHYLLERHQKDPVLRRRVMESIGSMYFRFFQDYPRAAFWLKKAGVRKGSVESVNLAECYWRLGNKKLALSVIDTRQARYETVKLLGDMGETRRALELAEASVRAVREPQYLLLAAGDACRTAGQNSPAMEYYTRVVESLAMRNEDYDRRLRDRARASLEALKLSDRSEVDQVANGAYRAESLGYEAPIAIEVVVEDGRIRDLKITEHREKQFYSALRDVPAQILQKQSVRGIDATSRATITAQAIVNATAKALADAPRRTP